MDSSRPSARGLAASAAIITAGSLTSRLLGLVREAVIAGLFGKSVVTSAFTTAATVPTMLYDLVIGGAVSAALIPVFAEYAASEGPETRANLGRAVGSVAAIVLGLLAVTSAVLIVLAPGLVSVLGVGPGDAAHALTVELVRIVLPSVVLLGLSSVATALLYARQSFVYPAFAAAAYNLGIVVGAVALAPSLGASGLALGVLLGAALQVGLQLIGVRRADVKLAVDLRHPAVGRVLGLYAPVALGLVVSQLGVVVDRNLAWRTGEDSLAVMRFATTLIQLPLGLIAAAVSFAILPRLAGMSEDEAGLAGYRSTLSLGLRFVLLGMLPATAFLAILREPVVRLVFERQAFDAAATSLTADALLLYAPQLPFAAVDQLLIFAFYARKNTLTPMLVGVLGVVTYVVLGSLAIGPLGLGLRGLVIANTIQNSLHAIVLALLLRRLVGPGAGAGVGRMLWRALLSLAPAACLCVAALGWLVQARGLELVVGLGAVVTGAALLYASALALLRLQEAADVVRLLRSLLRR